MKFTPFFNVDKTARGKLNQNDRVQR